MSKSERLIDIEKIWLETDKNIVVDSVAGSGKTTTLFSLLELSKHRVLIIAFNKSIQEEIQSKIDSLGLKQGKSMTMHSLGFKAIRNAGYSCTVKNSKNFELLKTFQKDFPQYFQKLGWEEKIKRSIMFMNMNDVSRMFLTNNVEEIFENMSIMDKTIYSFPNINKQWSDFIKHRDKSYEGSRVVIDFLDMIYIPVIKNLTIPISPYYLFLDEAQDFSLLQHKLIDKLLSQGHIKKWVAVGDKRQSIYSFAGALNNSFDMFLKKDNTIEMPLDICYRCSADIIEEANEVYDVMKSFKKDSGIVAETFDVLSIQDNSMIICRNTKPLIYLYFKLLEQNRKVFLNGEDFLKYLIEFSRPYQYDSVNTLNTKIGDRISKLSYKHDKTSDEEKEMFILNQNLSNFNMFHTNLCSHTNSVSEVQKKIEEVINMKEEEGCITLCTIHKSKGLEADTVYILNEHLIPSKFAKSEEQLVQENNLKYVARTRAKNQLFYLNLKIEEDEKDN